MANSPSKKLSANIVAHRNRYDMVTASLGLGLLGIHSFMIPVRLPVFDSLLGLCDGALESLQHGKT